MGVASGAAAAGAAMPRTASARLAILRITPNNSAGRAMLRAPRGVSGDLVQGPVAALGRGEPPALGRDRPALHAVGVVDDHVDVALLGRVVGDLVDARGAHPPPRLGQRPRDVLAHSDVVGRIVAGGVARDEDARELVERVLAVGLRIPVGGVADEHLLLVVAMPRPATAGEAALAGDHEVDDRPAPHEALLEGLARVADLVDLLADLRLLDGVLVGG